jgi:3D-(3,5/4)-trihydroxycyclohexane-1,2-dione acylhydrolase (decyclizing)
VIDLAAGADAIEQLSRAIKSAKTRSTATLIHIRSDPFLYAPDGESWWDVPVAQVSEMSSTGTAYARYLEERRRQRPLLG